MRASDRHRPESGTRGGLAAVGVAALMIGCCASAPLLVGLFSGIAATTLLGAGAAVAGALALTIAGVLIVRSRRRRACEVPLGAALKLTGEQPSGAGHEDRAPASTPGR